MKYCALYRVRARSPHRRRYPRRLAPACGPGPRTLSRSRPLLLGIAAYQPGGGALAWARKAKTIQNRGFCIIPGPSFPQNDTKAFILYNYLYFFSPSEKGRPFLRYVFSHSIPLEAAVESRLHPRVVLFSVPQQRSPGSSKKPE